MASGYREGAGVGTCDSACRPARRRSWSSSKMAARSGRKVDTEPAPWPLSRWRTFAARAQHIM